MPELIKNNLNNYKSNIIYDDEINLRELFNTIVKYKFKIFFFSVIVTLLTFIYVLSIPNSYKSSIILAPQIEENRVTGGLSSLASLAGVNIGGVSSKDPYIMMSTLLNDYSFNEYIIKKYNLIEKLENQENLVFALGFNSIYYMFDSIYSKDKKKGLDRKIFDNIKFLKKEVLSISSNKDSNLITISVVLKDRFLAKKLLDIYLEEIIKRIKKQDMKEIDKQIKYYNKELSLTHDISLKEQLSKSLSGLMQKRVFSQANDYYFVSKVIDSRVSYIKEKTKPKRALILVVSVITSLIIAVFLAFCIEFFRKEKNEK